MALASQLSFATRHWSQLFVPSQVEALASRFSYHVLTLILFTGNDFKTTILPMVCLVHRQPDISDLKYNRRVPLLLGPPRWIQEIRSRIFSRLYSGVGYISFSSTLQIKRGTWRKTNSTNRGARYQPVVSHLKMPLICVG